MKSWSAEHGALDLETLRGLYETRRVTPVVLVEGILKRIEMLGEEGKRVFISLVEREEMLAAAQRVEGLPRDLGRYPLWGVAFAVKDNIDVAGMVTTAACPGFGQTATKSAVVVEKLVGAGGILVGKTNLDQFATGLTGVVSPYGACRNPFGERYVTGGSSSGSAAAVARGVVSFALGTDTAGSGRVPAGFCNIVGMKPTKGLVSTRGVLPACRSLDCLSIFALTAPDAGEVLGVIKGYDHGDMYSRADATGFDLGSLPLPLNSFRFGVPGKEYLDFGMDESAAGLFAGAVERLERLGGKRVEIDFAAFAEAGRLLYEGPWLAERLVVLEEMLRTRAGEVHEVTRRIVSRAEGMTAAGTFKAMYALEALRRKAQEQWALMDVMVVPTSPKAPTIEEAQRDPAGASVALGRYTNFVNLLDMSAVAVPGGFLASGLPMGVTLLAPGMQDARLLHLATRCQRITGGTLGATGVSVESVMGSGKVKEGESGNLRHETMGKRLKVCVVGAHLSGLPLNHQLTELGGTLVLQCRTAAMYRLYALPGTAPPKPGMVRERNGRGKAIEVEVWELLMENVGAFVKQVPGPLCIGTIMLETGEGVHGFLCEGAAVEGATDISEFGGWRNYLASRNAGVLKVG